MQTSKRKLLTMGIPLRCLGLAFLLSAILLAGSAHAEWSSWSASAVTAVPEFLATGDIHPFRPTLQRLFRPALVAARPRQSGPQPGAARSGHAAQDGRGERLRGALRRRPREGRLGNAGGGEGEAEQDEHTASAEESDFCQFWRRGGMVHCRGEQGSMKGEGVTR